jgi:glutaredoxin 3
MTDITGNVNGAEYTITEAAAKALAEMGIDAKAETEAALAKATRSAELYTKNNCPYCVRAKALLTQEGIHFSEIDAVANKDSLIERVTKDTGRPPMTVPQIYLDGKYVGGYTELAALIAAEKNA